MHRTGDLIIADDVGNIVWRVIYLGSELTPPGNVPQLGRDSVLKLVDQVDSLPREAVAFGLAAEMAVGRGRADRSAC